MPPRRYALEGVYVRVLYNLNLLLQIILTLPICINMRFLSDRSLRLVSNTSRRFDPHLSRRLRQRRKLSLELHQAIHSVLLSGAKTHTQCFYQSTENLTQRDHPESLIRWVRAVSGEHGGPDTYWFQEHLALLRKLQSKAILVVRPIKVATAPSD